MSLVGSSNSAYTSSVGSSHQEPSSASSLFYYRHPALHHPYVSPHDPPQSYYLGSSWSESPGSSGRSVSPCDEYQPPLIAADYTIPTSLQDHQHQPVQTFVRVTKRRTTANKKERRRTQSINNAFADLRDCIPNVPSDTKLSKIKTLRLATSYIAYLMGVLADEDAASSGGGFRADLQPKRSTSVVCNARHSGHPGHVDEQAVAAAEHARRCSELAAAVAAERKSKGRTGWPQHVWALELKP